MRNLILLAAAMLIFCTSASAQQFPALNNRSFNYAQTPGYAQQEASVTVSPGLKYRELKNMYDYRMYVPALYDRHRPVWAGVASYFIPGLGQMFSGSAGRGFAWLGGAAALYAASGYAIEMVESDALIFAMCAVNLSMHICCIVDAVRVAKVRNMYEADLRRQGFVYDVDLYPSVNCVRAVSGPKTAVGMTLAMKF